MEERALNAVRAVQFRSTRISGLFFVVLPGAVLGMSSSLVCERVRLCFSWRERVGREQCSAPPALLISVKSTVPLRACRSLAHLADNLRPVHAACPRSRRAKPIAIAPTAAAQQQQEEQQQQATASAAGASAASTASSSISSHHGYSIFGLAIKLAFPLLSPARRTTVSCRGRHAVVSRLICFAPEPRFGRVGGCKTQSLASLFGSANHQHLEKQRLRLPTLPITTRFGLQYCVQFRFCHLVCRIRAIFTRRRLCSHSRPLHSKTLSTHTPRNLNPISKRRVRSLAAEPTHGVPIAIALTNADPSA